MKEDKSARNNCNNRNKNRCDMLSVNGREEEIENREVGDNCRIDMDRTKEAVNVLEMKDEHINHNVDAMDKDILNELIQQRMKNENHCKENIDKNQMMKENEDHAEEIDNVRFDGVEDDDDEVTIKSLEDMSKDGSSVHEFQDLVEAHQVIDKLVNEMTRKDKTIECLKEQNDILRDETMLSDESDSSIQSKDHFKEKHEASRKETECLKIKMQGLLQQCND